MITKGKFYKINSPDSQLHDIIVIPIFEHMHNHWECYEYDNPSEYHVVFENDLIELKERNENDN